MLFAGDYADFSLDGRAFQRLADGTQGFHLSDTERGDNAYAQSRRHHFPQRGQLMRSKVCYLAKHMETFHLLVY